MNGIIQLSLGNFALIYLLLLAVLFVMKKCHINQSKLVIVASLRMTVQLVMTGLVLTYIFENPHPLFTMLYLGAMTVFSINIALGKHKWLNPRFRRIVGISLACAGWAVMMFYLLFVVRVSIFNPQYAIPITGMILGNATSGTTVGLKTLNDHIKSERQRIDTLINMGVTPAKAMLPIVNKSIETATLPTVVSMLSMGIISLPGMMTGQILSGTMPLTAILYQISIIIAITSVTFIAVFCSLYFGYKTLYNERNQLELP